MTFRIQMVTMTEKVMSVIVKSKYFPRSGTARLVGGMISVSSKIKTVSERRMEMQSDIFSPESAGK